jgi:hypothetical protein
MFKLHSLFEFFAMCIIILGGWFLQLDLMHNTLKHSMIYISWTFDSFVLTIRKSSNEILGIMKILPNLFYVFLGRELVGYLLQDLTYLS